MNGFGPQKKMIHPQIAYWYTVYLNTVRCWLHLIHFLASLLQIQSVSENHWQRDRLRLQWHKCSSSLTHSEVDNCPVPFTKTLSTLRNILAMDQKHGVPWMFISWEWMPIPRYGKIICQMAHPIVHSHSARSITQQHLDTEGTGRVENEFRDILTNRLQRNQQHAQVHKG